MGVRAQPRVRVMTGAPGSAVEGAGAVAGSVGMTGASASIRRRNCSSVSRWAACANRLWSMAGSATTSKCCPARAARRIERAPSDLFVTCPPQVLEFCHSARTPAEHAHYREQISLGFPLERAPDESLVLDIQGALWNAGLARAAGPTDILIAAYAIAIIAAIGAVALWLNNRKTRT